MFRQVGYHAYCILIQWGKVSSDAAAEYSKQQSPIMKYPSSPSPPHLISKSFSFSESYNYWKLLCSGITICTVLCNYAELSPASIRKHLLLERNGIVLTKITHTQSRKWILQNCFRTKISKIGCRVRATSPERI